MKRLTLIRHAKSSWRDDGLADIERPLNKRGYRNAPMMGARLRLKGETFDRFYTSPALRARTTARLMAAELECGPETIEVVPALYTFNYEDLLNWVRSLGDGCDHVAVVCHNPAVTDLVNFLTLSHIENIPTCGVAKLSLESSHWKQAGAGCGALESYHYPRLEEDKFLGSAQEPFPGIDEAVE